ncbi:MAG: CHAP domain-containing protein [Eubacterium sp.]|uniref:CHAP domain-containing protein n=1 Tax=Eubacterium sp. TaxID=142586 RepID=UPI0025C221D7|nr:CHAP domain-containing protein [Eubacterium sp.]
MTFNKWVKENLGKGIDYDGTYGVQCVDLAKHYIKNVLGVTPQSIGNAIEYYNKRKTSEYLTKNFKWIDNTAEFIPKKGDLCVFTSKSGNGHISVATGEGTTSYFYSYDQNFPKAKHEPMTKIKHSYTSFLGVLRPKKKKSKSLKYFKAYKGDSKSIVDALEAIGAKSDFSYRKKIAAKNKIKDYKGTPEQNEKMLVLLKKGKLVKP